MSASSSHDDVVELVLNLRGLRITISGPAQPATQLASDIARLPTPRSGDHSPESTYTLVSSLPESRQPIQRQSPVRETRAEIEASFDLCPHTLLAAGSRLSSAGAVSGADRVRRAWVAGQWARAVLAGRAGSPNRTEQLGVRSRVYVVLRAPGLSAPTVVTSSAEYFKLVGRLQDSDSLSHSFPSETEARAYCLGAGIPLPASLQ